MKKVVKAVAIGFSLAAIIFTILKIINKSNKKSGSIAKYWSDYSEDAIGI
jgi:hypothetical protein